MDGLTKSDITKLLRERFWTVSALADRWGLSRRYVTAKMADLTRGAFWDDAFRGLPLGPGFYRRRAGQDAPPEVSALEIGSLVASEADMETFGYGSRGVVVEILGIKEWRVVWDGGSVMTIDQDCLDDWVVDLGIRIKNWEFLEQHNADRRIDIAKMISLYS